MNFKYDVFVSYAHVDNEDGWVKTLVSKLRATLLMRNAGKPLNVFFDSRQINANSVLDDMLEAARQSRVFLAVGSRAYVSSERFTLKELAAFHEVAHDDPKRTFVLQTLPLREGQVWPDPIAGHTPQEFFAHDEGDDTACTMTLESHGLRYMREINRLAEAILSKLGQLQAAPATAPSSAPAQAHASTTVPISAAETPGCAGFGPGLECKRVLVAQTTDALEDEVADLRQYLAKFGVELLPSTPFPQGGAEFRAAYCLDLDRADLVVNLLDRRPGRCPPDLAEGYTMFQLNAARSNKVPIMQWRDPRIDLAEVANSEYREVLNGPDVMACGFEEFKDTVRKTAIKPVAKDRPTNGAIVYVHASPQDKDIARQIGEKCGRYKLLCHLPQFDQRTINTDAIKQRLSNSNAVLYLNCNADQIWAQSEMDTVYKYVQREGGQIVALCFAPPEKSEMFVFPDARIIKGTSESQLMEQIDTLLRELAA